MQRFVLPLARGRLMPIRFWSAVVVGALASVLGSQADETRAADPSLPAEQAPDFNTHLAPLFTQYCTGCHNTDDAEGGLVLERYEELMKGGRRGSAVLSGKPDSSRLLLVLDGRAQPAMPPAGNPAPKPAEVELLRRWIEAGARSPTGALPDRTLLVVPQVPVSGTPRRPITAAAFSPDGRWLALGSYQSVQLVPAPGADQPAAPKSAAQLSLAPLRGTVNELCFSADSQWLLTAAGEPGLFGEMSWWNVADGQLIRSWIGHRDNLYAAALSPDARLAASGSYDEQVQLWDVEKGTTRGTLSGHNGAIFALTFGRQGKLLASASGDRTVKLWDVARQERLDTFGQSQKELYALAFHPSGNQLAAGGVDNRIRVWRIGPDAREGQNPLLLSRFAHEAAIVRLAYSPDGETLASAAEDGTVRLWDAATIVERRTLEKQSDQPSALCFSATGQHMLVGRMDGSHDLYEVASGRKLASRESAKPRVQTVAFQSPAKPAKKQSKSPATSPAAAAAPPAKPEVTALEPRGIERGQPAQIKLNGKHLANIQKITFAPGKISAEQLSARVVEVNAPGTQATLELRAAASLPLGGYELSLETPGGASAAIKFQVDDLPQQMHDEALDARLAGWSPSATSASADPLPTVALPASIWGVIAQSGDADLVAFQGRAGQTVVIDLAAAAFGSKLNGLLSLLNEQGQPLAISNDFDGQSDPLLAVTLPADGRYRVRISDLLLAGSAEHFYRVSLGTFPYVTACFPLHLPANRATEVELVGYNLPANTLAVEAAGQAEVTLPLESRGYRSRRRFVLPVVPEADHLEREPNDRPDQATPLSAPGAAQGRLFQPQSPGEGEIDLYRFSARRGEAWIVETEAAQRGSPLDTRLEVLDAAGRPVPRLLLQATRDSYITFRPIDSQTVDARVKNWEEMELNEWMYLQGEVCKIFRMPQGPDSGFNFYALANRRRTYFDTSATTHALDEPCYIVEPLPPDSRLVPNGLPVFPLYYANDDDAERKLGSDSRLTFTAPADGEYLVRVSDIRQQGGPRMAYRLVIRRPQPDFRVTIGGGSPQVAAGSGKTITFTADRRDGFDGEIALDVSGLPPGFALSGPLVIQAGHVEAKAVLSADAAAPAPSKENAAASQVMARALINGSPVVHAAGSLGNLSLLPAPNLLVSLEPAELVITPGQTITATLKVVRNDFKERVNFSVDNLPHGVIVDNIGLNGVLIPEGQTQRQIFLSARPWVPPTERPFQAVASNAGGQTSRAVLLKVRARPSLTK